MKKVRMGLFFLLILFWNVNYFQGFLSLDLNDTELIEEVQPNKITVPRLTSEEVNQSLNAGENQTLNEIQSQFIEEGLKGFVGGFLENKGQKNDAIFYYTENLQIGVGFGSSVIYLSVLNPIDSELSDEEETEARTYTTVNLALLGSNNVVPVAEGPTGVYTNYFLGSDQIQWVVNCQYYTKVIYYNIYEKIDLVYELKAGQLKYEFFVHPGGRVEDIKLQWNGPLTLELLDVGIQITIYQKESINDELSSEFSFIDTIPINYQSLNREKPIEGAFNLMGPTTYGFNVLTYNPKKLLIIDPLLNLSYSTYVGGSGSDGGDGACIALDGVGNVYVTGDTVSVDFPSVNAYESNDGMEDVFVFKLNSTGNGLLYSTYVGGSDPDLGHAITVDDRGNAYVTGRTFSSDFPTMNAYDTTNDGSYDVFVFKLNSTGNGLLYSTYIGGTSDDYGYSITLDGTRNAYITGYTTSTDFPTVNAYETDDGNWDVFVFKLNSTGNGLVYSTYVGGSDYDVGQNIMVDSANNAYVTGYTASTDFPTLNAYETDDGGDDVFVFKLAANGSTLLYSTYVGGSLGDRAYSIVLDEAGNAYVTGWTDSTDFPTVNPYETNDGGRDVIVFKLAANGSTLLYSTYVGGSNDEEPGYHGITIDALGNIYVTGWTKSTNFPPVNAYNSTGDGDTSFFDIFVFKLNNTGNGLLYSTYIAGTANEKGNDIDLDRAGYAYITGYTDSTDFPTVNAYDSTNNGGEDICVAKLSFNSNPIYIDDNSDFQTLGFPGDGSSNNPYRIEGYQIVNSTTNLIHIQDTTSYFIIRYNGLDGVTGATNHGIYLHNVVNGNIESNFITRSNYGIYLGSASGNNTVQNNTVFDSSKGIHLWYSDNNNSLLDNVVYDTSSAGMDIQHSHNTTLIGNQVFLCAYGIVFSYSHNCILKENSISNNTGKGFGLFHSNRTLLHNNIIYNISGEPGIQLDTSYNNNISNNEILECNDYGIEIISSSAYNLIEWNIFIDNTGGASQAYDECPNNIFQYNYWNDLTSPDSEPNGIVDNPYNIDGGSNTDPYPLIFPYIHHAPIIVDENSDFAALGFPGDGTPSDPYLIKGYAFKNSTENLIEIYNTSAYFTIQNSLINGVNGTNLGIYLENVTHGLITLNIFHSCGRGIYVNLSSNLNVISNNTVYNNTRGIQLAYLSDNITISNNTLYNNNFGIMLSVDCNNNTISNNFCYDNSWSGIGLTQAGNNTIINNTFQNDGGLYLFGWTLTQCRQTEVSNNILNGKPIIFWQDVIGGTVPFGGGQIILVNCSKVEITNSDLSDSQVGLFATFCNELMVHQNNFSNHIFEGIWLWEVHNTTISDNIICFNGYDGLSFYIAKNITVSRNTINNNSNNGILFTYYAENCIIRGNNIANNSLYGLSLEDTNFTEILRNEISYNKKEGIFIEDTSENLLVKYNNFIGNRPGNKQAYDNGISITFSYNYWNDWTSPDVNGNGIVDNFYNVNGTTNNNDTLPLVHPYYGYITRDPILITSNADFGPTLYDFPGSGTSSDPYLIEGYNITDDTGNLIQISSTTVYFIILNNWLEGPNNSFARGIYFSNVDHGSIIANNLSFNYYGICLSDSSINIISNNSVFNTSRGIYLGNSPDNIVFNNSVSNNSYSGISLDGSSNYNNTVFNNTIFDNPWFGIVTSSNCTIEHNTIYNNYRGIYIANDEFVEVIHNTFFNNSRTIELDTNSLNNTVYKNIISNSTQWGIYVNAAAEDNLIYLNDFINNADQAYVPSANNNNWSDGTYGNYWSDYTGVDANGDGIGDTPYDVNAGEGIQDPYPLMNSQEWYYIFEGDWIVTGQESHYSKIITLNGSLIVQPGGNLTLSNVILRLNCSTNGQFYVEVNGGNLTIIRDSVITSVNTSNAWYLQAHPGSAVTLKNSTFCYAGWSDAGFGDWSGLWFNTNNTYIVNCTIHNNYYGLTLYQANNSVICNNTITSNLFYGIFQAYSSFSNLSHNILQGNTDHSVLLSHAHNNTYRNNEIINTNGDGLRFLYSTNNTFYGNNIYNNTGTGIKLAQSSHNNTLIHNTIDKSLYYGIYVWESSFNRIINNTVSNNGQSHAGIRLSDAANFTFLYHNTFFNNTYDGIFVDSCSNTTIISNTIHENSRYGIWLYNGSFTLSENNTISYNIIYNNTWYGIRLEGHVNTLISYNIISDNIHYGIFLGTNSINTTVLWNNLRNNNQGSTQGYDSGIDNEFSYNYWDDHIDTDADVDGIYDNAYSIPGDSNSDPYPRSHPALPHTIILINHESNFTALGFPGQGTLSNPYIIEECFISDTGSLIQIVNISAYFIIRSNFLIGKTGGTAIDLVNCTNGLIIENKIQNTTTGIYLFESSNNTIINNIVTNTIFGMILTNDSTSNLIYSNSIYNNSAYGIIVSFTNNNNITSNLIFNNTHVGVSLFCANNNTVSNNTIYNQFNVTVLGHGISILPYKHLNAEHNTIINNSIYNNANDGIYANSSAYNTISFNRIFNNSRNGIYIVYASFENITGNLIWNNGGDGFFLNNSHINTITDNFIYNNSFNGFVLSSSQDNFISNNTITQNDQDGFHLFQSFNNTLVNNSVSYNSFEGVILESSTNNSFTLNSVFKNAFNGIKLTTASANNTFILNRVYNNTGVGILINVASFNILKNNSIYNHTYFGVYIENSASENNSFIWNDFLTNNVGASQAYDSGLNTIFIYNYWDDHTGPDSDSDGIFDNSYSIEGTALNSDPRPLVSPNNPALIHTLSIPIVLYPNGGEVLSGIINIQWTEAIDSYGLEVLYTVYYSANNGITWVELASGIINTNYPWNTVSHPNRTSYLVRVDANSNGLTESDDSDATFTIQNPPINESIVIIGNTGFESLGVPGDGTEGDPYVIEGLYFVDNSMIVIHIMHTDVHFIIRNNIINGSSGENFGVHFLNVTNGRIENNRIYNCSDGIAIFDSLDCVVFNNNIYHNSENGIHILASNFIEVSANIIRFNGANGIFLENSNDNTISDNIIYGNGDTDTGTGIGASFQATNRGNGIFLDPANNNLIENNTIHSNLEDGIYLLESDESNIHNNTINNNGGNGVTLEDSNENWITNNTIYGNGDTGTGTGIGSSLHATSRGNGIFLDPSDTNVISGNEIYDNTENGIYILESETNNIFGNLIYGNQFNGILLILSNLNSLFENLLSGLSSLSQTGVGSSVSTTTEVTVSNRGNGIFLEASNENNISLNNIMNHTNYGMVVDEESNDNLIQWNDFFGNKPEGTSQAYDDGSNNEFIHNYWDDHDNSDTNGDGVADSHYKIDGTANNYDQSPMATPDGELLPGPPTPPNPFLIILLILLIISLGGVSIAYINRERIKIWLEKRSKKRRPREYDSLVEKAEELARTWERDLD